MEKSRKDKYLTYFDSTASCTSKFCWSSGAHIWAMYPNFPLYLTGFLCIIYQISHALSPPIFKCAHVLGMLPQISQQAWAGQPRHSRSTGPTGNCQWAGIGSRWYILLLRLASQHSPPSPATRMHKDVASAGQGQGPGARPDPDRVTLMARIAQAGTGDHIPHQKASGQSVFHLTHSHTGLGSDLSMGLAPVSGGKRLHRQYQMRSLETAIGDQTWRQGLHMISTAYITNIRVIFNCINYENLKLRESSFNF